MGPSPREPWDRPDEAQLAFCPTRRFSGFIPAGMLDWPGKVAATMFLSGCGFRCPFCHNPQLLKPVGTGGDWEALLAHLEAKRSWLDGVVVTGGEPTDDPDLPSLCAALTERGVPVKLDTNGSRPKVLRLLLAEDLVSYVAMDVKAAPGRYGEVSQDPHVESAVRESVRLLVDSGVDHEFRTTAYPGLVGLDDLPAIAEGLRGGRLYAVQQFRPDVTLDPAASGRAPYRAFELQNAASRCCTYLPTIVRGAS